MTRGRFELDIAFGQGDIVRGTNPLRSIAFRDRAIEGYTLRNLPLNLAAALLSRARARLAAGAEAGAESDLRSAIELFERQHTSVEDDGLRLLYAETAQGLFDELLLLQVRRRPSAREGLLLSERAHTCFGASRTAAVDIRRIQQNPPDTVLVEYALPVTDCSPGFCGEGNRGSRASHR